MSACSKHSGDFPLVMKYLQLLYFSYFWVNWEEKFSPELSWGMCLKIPGLKVLGNSTHWSYILHFSQWEWHPSCFCFIHSFWIWSKHPKEKHIYLTCRTGLLLGLRYISLFPCSFLRWFWRFSTTSCWWRIGAKCGQVGEACTLCAATIYHWKRKQLYLRVMLFRV